MGGTRLFIYIVRGLTNHLFNGSVVLPGFVVEEIRRRERQQRERERQQPQLDLPIPLPLIQPKPPQKDDPDPDPDRGVIVIELL